MISLDFETFSECDIKKAGTSRYAEDPSTEILCLAYAIGDEDPVLWIAGDVPPHKLFENVKQGVSAFNALFEIQIWKNICVKRMGWPDIPLESWYDTQADCLALGLPDSLDKASSALSLPHKKDRKGTTLINKLCKPRKPTAKNPSTRIRKQDDPEAFRELYLYCKQDVRVERYLRNSLPYRQTESGLEREIYLSTIRANMRGIPIDVITLKRINALIEEKLSRLQHDIFKLTDGAIASINQNQAIQAFLNENWPELKLKNMQGDTIDRLLKKDIDPRAREILVCYSQGNYASIKKFKKIAMQLCADGTIKDNQQYHGAATGRDAGRGVQVQNLPIASISDPEFAIEAVRTCSLDDIEFLYGNILELASALCRPILMAKKGRMFANADLSQIEDRKAAWVTKEQNILDNYRKGVDAYCATTSFLFDIPLEKIDRKNPLRQAGKITNLQGIFGGGAGAIMGMAEKFGYVYTEEKAQGYANKFRANRPKLVNSWYAFGSAARDAVLNPDVLQLVSTNEDFQFLFHDKQLYLRMPNGRKICFPFAKWEMIPDQKIKLKTGKTFFIKAHYGLTHWWCNTEKGKRWEKREIRGPSLFQSAVQGLARDVLMEAILRLEKENYPHLFRVHDEVTCDVPDDASFDLQHFARVFSETPDWCKDLPIDCDPWLNKRFKK